MEAQVFLLVDGPTKGVDIKAMERGSLLAGIRRRGMSILKPSLGVPGLSTTG